MTRVVIGDDDTRLRGSLARLLSAAGHDVVGTAGDGSGLVRQACAERAELVIADVRMPPSQRDEGLQAARRIRACAPETAVVVLSQHLQVRYALELLAADARGVGYLLKQRLADVGGFLSALDRVAAGGTVVDAEIAEALVVRLRAPALGADERAVLVLVAQGRGDVPGPRVARAFAALGLPPVATPAGRVRALVRRAAATTQQSR